MNPTTQFILSAFLLLTGVIIVLIILLWVVRFLFYVMARDNILFTLRTEGEIRAVMFGEKCIRYVMAVENYIIDPDDFDIFKGNVGSYEQHLYRIGLAKKTADPHFVEKKLLIDTTTGNPLPQLQSDFRARLIRANTPSWFEKVFGVVWVGISPHHVFTYRFVWTKYKQGTVTENEAGQRNTAYEMIPREEDAIDSLYFRYPTYGLFIGKQETGSGSVATLVGTGPSGKGTLEKVQVDLDLVFETVTTNPQKTLFRSTGLSSAGDWLLAIIAEIETYMRVWVGERTYDDLLNAQRGGASLDDSIREVIEQVNKKTIPDYGQEVTRIRIVAVELTDKSIQESVLTFFREKQKADAAVETARGRVTLAEATRKEQAAVLLGQADGYEAIAMVTGGHGPGMYRAEQIGAGGIKVLTVGGGSGPIMNLPESVFGEPSSPPPQSDTSATPPTGEQTPPIAQTSTTPLSSPTYPQGKKWRKRRR